ncbi:MAG TPA: glycosyl hydrolase family 8, partial [Chitinivibrionales bacterium]
MRPLKIIMLCAAAAILMGARRAQSAMLPFPITMPAVSQSYDSILLKTWSGIKKRNIDGYSIPLVHRPKSEQPDDAVSEGVGYGLFCALYCNDQTYFNKLWDAAEQYLWSATAYNWRVDKNGTVIGSGAASDAEEDIACALIFADLLTKRGVWQTHTSSKGATYAVRAQSMLNNIWNNLVESGKYLRPGDNWGGAAFVNPGYFAPAFYRVFSEFGSTKHDWSGLIDQCYKSVALSKGAAIGLVPDWMKPDGGYCDSSQLGYNAYAGGRFCYKDGIRILWRLATDYLWYGEPRAKSFLDKSLAFVKSPDRANFYQMSGAAVTDSFKLGNGVNRPRSEHSHLTIGMWAAAAMAAGSKATADSFSVALLDFYTPGADFFGKATEPTGEDTLHNEMYFDQFLAWFGASLMSGIFTNLWEDLKDTNITIPLQWKSAPVFSGTDIDANVNPLKIFGTLSKSARWTITLKQRAGDSSVTMLGSSDTVSAVWYGLSAAGGAMPAGRYDISVTVKGLSDPVSDSCWLGRALDLKVNNRLLIDDFRDKDLVPYFGAQWQSYLDSYEGKSGKSTVPVFTVAG